MALTEVDSLYKMLEEAWAEENEKYVAPSSRYLGRWIADDEDEETDSDVCYQFANGSTIRPVKRRRRSRYPKFEYFSAKDIGHSDLFDKPTEPPELEAGDTTQLDSFLGSFTTK